MKRPISESSAPPITLPPGLTYEQHKELLLLQFEHENFRKAHLKAEQTRLEIEQTKLTVRVTLTSARVEEIQLLYPCKPNPRDYSSFNRFGFYAKF